MKVDPSQIYADYARSIGKEANELTEAERCYAMFAYLEAANALGEDFNWLEMESKIQDTLAGQGWKLHIELENMKEAIYQALHIKGMVKFLTRILNKIGKVL